MKLIRLTLLLALLYPIFGLANPEKKELAFVASVNNAPITQQIFDVALKNAIERGAKDSPELRQAIKEELINRELLVQEAKKEGLEKSPEFISQVDQFEQTLLLQLYIDQHFQKNPITDEQLKAEYERQKKLIVDTGGEVQYRFSQIVTAKESEAMILMSRLQKGDSFAQLAREFSADAATKKEGGSVGWVNASQMNANVLQTLRLLNKNEFAKKPIQIGSAWVIVRLDDKRAMKIPTLEESKPQLRQAIVQQYLTETVRRLRQNAKIVM
ncbi:MULTISPECIES: peptidylprolyl isomerase [unclassified Polynucleobacter]|uniref:peptidylprolyl isomerase n=1 Tax=unclassified Polynucleobacter TaxID=2640945 RepID=UPI002572F319|nr:MULTISPECIES: peptidylprolyl isomerase [unclassified Polynucleobacter]BEI43152.1 peptidylprolyl isomerase [Polynucleobacter sp. HIN10]BEI44929.1 peptidylprolyl isomerase [Polynucleobacter sp. HIN11]